MSGYGTKFAETELLLAVMDNDIDAAVAIIKDMYPNERRAMKGAALRLHGLINDYSPSRLGGET